MKRTGINGRVTRNALVKHIPEEELQTEITKVVESLLVD